MKKNILPLALLSFFCVVMVAVICLPTTQLKAKHIAQTAIENMAKAEIKDHNHPYIKKVEIPKGSEYTVVSDNTKWTDIQGKKVWQITYHTTNDGLNPIVVYIDYYNGKLYGFAPRC
ncbi:hypothetical protein RBG61_04875 [Paludicola sp. MB14-C6]|uniref:hypothetical protein n=1 Tax=Paludihabitans sp. MB14-C6 TaxID=3070656 RepID=UPI0027DE9FB5|nr:hypothetical protein [Paludicola sp. MB14-C6]WMJ24006.1 hypothetical protein RBG61_04875 [Paludicola sp. MB14-C6]